MYAQSLLADIKRKLTLSEVIGKIVQLRRKGHEYHGLCPFHQEKTPSFTVNNQKEFYHCFGCGQHGSVFDFLMHQNHLTFSEAIAHAAEMAGVSLPTPSSAVVEENQTKKILLEILESACDFFEKRLSSPEGLEAYQYLTQKRKISPLSLKKFRLGVSSSEKNSLKNYLLGKGYGLSDIKAAGLLTEWDDGTWHDKFRHRVMFPIFNRKGQVIAFGGRILGPGEPKYLNSPETPLFHKGITLYNWGYAQQSSQKKDPLVVVEGYLDVISLFQHGYDRVVAPLGTALTEEQLHLLWRLCPEPLLCFDGDAAGQRAARRAAERSISFLSPGQSLSFLALPSLEDPDTYIHSKGIAGWRMLLAQAQPLSTFLWETERALYTRKTPEEKALLEKTLDNFCTQIQDPTVKAYYKQEFKNRLFSWNTLPRKKMGSPNPLLQKMNVSDLQERILLASILLTPSLENHIHEEFALIPFQAPLYQSLQKAMLAYFSGDFPLEKEFLAAYLVKEGYEKVLESLLGSDLFVHAPFLKLAEESTSLEHWNQIRYAHNQKLWEKEELKEAKERLRINLSPEEWQRYKELKESVASKNEETEV